MPPIKLTADLIDSIQQRIAALDELLAATHSLLEAQQHANDTLWRTVWALGERIDLIEEWARMRLEQIANGGRPS